MTFSYRRIFSRTWVIFCLFVAIFGNSRPMSTMTEFRAILKRSSFFSRNKT
ncbi:Uncharacterized protein APZ42_020337 [Daphnia magna]|uniref:Uncharacterized protein n=1 Tax=Daphnia magna TaxID=35525 RepID=A0A164XLZ1_9CRUS|nr:Uncharacterized protein APZ42_020337 [Daphnia magna]